MKAILNLDHDKIEPWGRYFSKRGEDFTYFPIRLMQERSLVIDVVPSLNKKLGDYKFIYERQIVWVFKEFIEFDPTLSDEDLEIVI